MKRRGFLKSLVWGPVAVRAQAVAAHTKKRLLVQKTVINGMGWPITMLKRSLTSSPTTTPFN